MLSFISLAQDTTSNFIKPVRLPDSINSSAEEIYPLTFENEMFFVRTFDEDNKGGEVSGHDIWRSYKTKTGDWNAASNDMETLNTSGSNAIFGISNTGGTFYLMNLYEGNTDSSEAGVSISYRTGNIWTEPDSLYVPEFHPISHLYGVYIDPKEEVMFISMETEESLGKEDLFVSVKTSDTSWSKVVHLKDISSDSYDMSPFLGPDRETLYFSSAREGGHGNADVYVAQKGETWLDWSKPKNLGKVINSEGFDAYFSIYADSTAYFSSNRDGNTDIYESELVGERDTTHMADEEGNIVYKFDRENYVYFGFDKAVLKPSMRNFLNDVISKLNADELRKVTLEGHTDYIGTEEYNYELGKERAVSVREYMEKRGIPSDKIITKSFGESQPKVKARKDGGDIPSARAKNRRVHIEIVKAVKEKNNKKKKGKKKKKKI